MNLYFARQVGFMLAWQVVTYYNLRVTDGKERKPWMKLKRQVVCHRAFILWHKKWYINAKCFKTKSIFYLTNHKFQPIIWNVRSNLKAQLNISVFIIQYEWQITRPASPLFTQPFIQAQIKENNKASRHWPLCGEFTGDRWIPPQRANNAENISIWWRHHVGQGHPNTCRTEQNSRQFRNMV